MAQDWRYHIILIAFPDCADGLEEGQVGVDCGRAQADRGVVLDLTGHKDAVARRLPPLLSPAAHQCSPAR